MDKSYLDRLSSERGDLYQEFCSWAVSQPTGRHQWQHWCAEKRERFSAIDAVIKAHLSRGVKAVSPVKG